MRLPAALVLLALAVAGCSFSWSDETPGPPTTTVAEDLMAHRAVGDRAEAALLPQAFAGLQVATVDTGYSGAEPTIGVTSQGSVFATAYEWVVRSRDGGVTWQVVHRAPGGQDFDPMIWVEPVTDRILATHINPQKTCRTIAVSDDDGDSWSDETMVCPPASSGQVDHQKLASGPHAGPLASVGQAGYERLVTLCYNDRGSTHCAASYDGGITFPQGVPVDGIPAGGTVPLMPGPLAELVGDCGGLNGAQHHAADGTIYVPYGYECRESRIAVSTDGGATWTRRNPRQGELELDPAVATTSDGMAYYLYRGVDHRMHILRSDDHFATFDGPFVVSPPEVKSTVFAAMVSGTKGRIAFAYLGTNGTDAGPDKAPDTADWNVYMGLSLDADAASPTIVTVRANPTSDPVQRGSICMTLPCRHDDRNLLDFIGMAMGPDGRAWVSYADGCTSEACLEPGQTDTRTSRDDALSVAWVRAGPSLLAEKGAVRPPADHQTVISRSTMP